ncbi:MAG: hypothetical protein KF760_29470 [Candidatus Eremiobacteraeota bacterium]|nr:hypothetical protein [Candidatus Eremiobacteraeota bacterium]
MRKLILGFAFLAFFLYVTAYTVYHFFKHSIVDDPAKKAALAGEIAPGAVPPTGFGTGEAFTMGMRGVTYREKGGQRLLMLFENPAPKEKPKDMQTALKDFRAKQDRKSQAVVDQESLPEMATHLGPIQVLQRQVHFPDGRSKIDFLVLAQNPKLPNKLITVMADAPVTPEEDGKFLAEYLGHLEVAPWVSP